MPIELVPFVAAVVVGAVQQRSAGGTGMLLGRSYCVWAFAWCHVVMSCSCSGCWSSSAITRRAIVLLRALRCCFVLVNG
jgi:hypothetical protein